MLFDILSSKNFLINKNTLDVNFDIYSAIKKFDEIVEFFKDNNEFVDRNDDMLSLDKDMKEFVLTTNFGRFAQSIREIHARRWA